MKFISKNFLYLFLFLNILLTESSLAWFSPATQSAEDGVGVAYVFATGPYLYDPTERTHIKGRRFYTSSWNEEYDSKYAKSLVDSIVAKVRVDYPEAVVVHVKDFSHESLARTYDDLSQLSPKIIKVILVITAHGGISDGNFSIENYGDRLSGQELGLLTTKIYTETALFTCHSGGVDVNDFSGPIFGASLLHTKNEAEHYYDWANFVLKPGAEKFPRSAKEFYESWWKSRVTNAVYAMNSKFLKRIWNWWYKIDLEEIIREESERFSLGSQAWRRSHPFWYGSKNS